MPGITGKIIVLPVSSSVEFSRPLRVARVSIVRLQREASEISWDSPQ